MRAQAPVLAIVGVTASGKSALAMELARRHAEIELVSIDSMQVYRRMDIGTAKPTAEERADVAHHLIDIAEPSEDMTLSDFQSAARAALADVAARGARPVLVGGTGLHLRAVVDDLEIPARYPAVAADLEEEPDTAVLYERLVALDPVGAARMEATNRRRVIRALEVTLGSGKPFSGFGPGLETYGSTRFTMVGPRLARTQINRRIEQRYATQVERGFVEEVAALAAEDPPLSRAARQALGYRQLLEHVAGRQGLDEALGAAMSATRQFARRQERWFRRDPRIVWIDVDANPMEAMGELVRQWHRCI